MGQAFHPHWIAPQWSPGAGVEAVCTTRAGGVSPAPYDSLNLGAHVKDWGYNVMANRNALKRAIRARPVYLSQVHGRQVAVLDEGAADGVEADACVTATPGIACTIMVADCLPVLFSWPDAGVVAAAHAGWRGLCNGVIEAAVDAAHGLLARRVGTTPGGGTSSCEVWLGPCIGPHAFEVGEEVRAAFCEVDSRDASAFAALPDRPGKYLADLPALARARLQRLGMEQVRGNDGSKAWCTVANPSRFFSFRRDGVTGRFAASVWLTR